MRGYRLPTRSCLLFFRATRESIERLRFFHPAQRSTIPAESEIGVILFDARFYDIGKILSKYWIERGVLRARVEREWYLLALEADIENRSHSSEGKMRRIRRRFVGKGQIEKKRHVP